MIPDIIPGRSQPSPILGILLGQLLIILVKPDLHAERSRLRVLPAVRVFRLFRGSEPGQGILRLSLNIYSKNHQAENKKAEYCLRDNASGFCQFSS